VLLRRRLDQGVRNRKARVLPNALREMFQIAPGGAYCQDASSFQGSSIVITVKVIFDLKVLLYPTLVLGIPFDREVPRDKTFTILLHA